VATDKIKKAITWIRKSLEITEKTTNPGTVGGEITPMLDALGWDRMRDADSFTVTSGANVNTISAVAVPADTVRLVLAASVQTDNNLLAFNLWLDHFFATNSTSVGLMRPVALPISAVAIRVGVNRPFLMAEGDILRGRSSPASGATFDLILRAIFIDLPIGEYIPGYP